MSKPSSRSTKEIEQWLVTYLSRALELEQEKVELGASFDQFGLDSSAAATMAGDLADWLGIELDPVVVFEHPTIARLSAHLSGQV